MDKNKKGQVLREVEGFNQLNNFIKDKINAKRYSTGFTIIEVIVVVSLILILSGVVIYNFSSSKLNFSLLRVSYQFEQDVSRVQNMALSSVPYKDSLGVEQEIDGYGVYVDLTGLGNTNYIIYADKSPGNNIYDVSDYIISQVDFSQNEPGIIIKQMDNIIGDSTSLNFKLSNISTSIDQMSPGQDNISVVFAESSDLSKTKSVLINKSGLIKAQ